MSTYDITLLETLTASTNLEQIQDSIKLDDNHIISVGYNSASKGALKTFSIDEDGNTTLEDTYTDPVSYYINSSLAKLDDTHFILYCSHNGVETIKIFSFDSSFNITLTSSYVYASMDNSRVVRIDDTHFITAKADGVGDGHVATYSVDGSYAITQINTIEHDGQNGRYNSLVKIDDTHYALAFQGTASNYGYIKVFALDASYNVSQIKSFLHNYSGALYNSLVKIDDTHYALSFQKSYTNGELRIFEIDASYNISKLSSLSFDAGLIHANSLIKIDDTHLVVAYSNSDKNGYIKTFEIDDAWDTTEINSQEYADAVQIREYMNYVVYMDTMNTLAIDYFDYNIKYEYIKTFSIDAPIATGVGFNATKLLTLN